MSDGSWLNGCSRAFRLIIATSWLAPDVMRTQQEQSIREAVNGGVDWTEYLFLVDRHRTPALSWSALKRVPGLDIPEFAERQLKQRSDACRLQAVRHMWMLTEVLKGFQSAGIPVMPMKGPLLSLDLYDDVGVRQSKDLDLLVLPQDITRTRACLEQMGWSLDPGLTCLTPRQWEACLKQDRHIEFRHPDGRHSLEIHWRCNRWDTPEQTTRRWARATPSVFQGYPYQAMNFIDQTLYLCSHGSEHVWCRAKWLGDLARMYSGNRVDWAAALEEACETNQERPLLLCLRLLREAYGLPLPTSYTKDRYLPPFLIHAAAGLISEPEEYESQGPFIRLRNGFRKTRYHRQLRPDHSLRHNFADLAYVPEDFRTLRLPDILFWAYVPLRPFLWAWRRLVRTRLTPRTAK